MRTDEIRKKYLEFFKSKGHEIYPSDSLVPTNDPSLMFTSAGMAQFKDMFLGIGKLPHKRITTVQRCLRVGDLESVGRTARHHTFFEMLGNFAFGDYFKEQAIPWCWEFYTKVLGIPPERLWPSIYEKDEEAFAIWTKLGVLKNPITRLGEADNFWPANAPSQGPNGPCGPCSELYYDFGKDVGCKKPACSPGCNCDRFVEICNIVFTQYERQEGGVLKPLPQCNIDFGGGLERVAAVLQGVHSNFEIDIFKAIIARIEAVLGMPTGQETRRYRRIADHIRALTFCIADGVRPGNEGRGYVVRRVLRTAFRDGWKLLDGAGREKEPFLHKVVATVVEQMKSAYPFLVERCATVEDSILNEEKQFLRTIERGLGVIEEHVQRVKKAGSKVLGGKEAFDLYQSHGFPIELTLDILEDQGISVDIAGYKKALQEEQDRARTNEAIFDPNSPLTKIKERKFPLTEFLGYGVRVADIGKPVEVQIQRIVKLDKDAWDRFSESKKDMAGVSKLIGKGSIQNEAATGDLVAILCDKTPFYAEGGGQAGDAGWLRTDEGEVEVVDTRRPDGYYFHFGKITKGTVRAGTVQAQVDAPRRLNIMRNHTGTHLLHAALRTLLGSHVTQAGSVVDPHRLRFDFTHPKALTRDEIRAIEDRVNRVIFEDRNVTKVELSMEDAKKKGALMFFGDKYGDRVRVVTIGDSESVELCGGTHLEHSATIGQFKITSESAIGSGVRRIEAVTGPGAVETARKQDEVIAEVARELGCPIADVPRRIKQIAKDVHDLKTEIGKLKKGGASAGGTGVDQVIAGAFEVKGEKFIAHPLASGTVDDARTMMDVLVKNKKIAAAILAVPGEKPAFLIGVREDLPSGIKAGDLAKAVSAACGTRGGGRDTMAQVGMTDSSQVQLGLETFEKSIRSTLG